jgi:putative flippase GtrA
MVKKLWLKLWKIRIFNFMFVGGLGFCLNLVIYYPLTLLIHNSIKFLDQVFYLPALLITAPIVIAFNYWMNKKWTFKGEETKALSLGRYETMGLSTMIFDLFIIYGLVHYVHIFYLIAMVIATIVMFLGRYFIANRWIWKTKTGVKKCQTTTITQ